MLSSEINSLLLLLLLLCIPISKCNRLKSVKSLQWRNNIFTFSIEWFSVIAPVSFANLNLGLQIKAFCVFLLLLVRGGGIIIFYE